MVSVLFFDTQKPVYDECGKDREHRETGNGKAGVDATRHQNGEGQEFPRLHEMPKRRCGKGHIDEEVHPVDIGIRYEGVAAVRVHDANGDTNIIGNVLKHFLGEPSPRKGDRHQFENHDDGRGVQHLSVPENEKEKAERTDEKIQKGPRHVRTPYDRVGVIEGGFPLHDVE